MEFRGCLLLQWQKDDHKDPAQPKTATLTATCTDTTWHELYVSLCCYLWRTIRDYESAKGSSSKSIGWLVHKICDTSETMVRVSICGHWCSSCKKAVARIVARASAQQTEKFWKIRRSSLDLEVAWHVSKRQKSQRQQVHSQQPRLSWRPLLIPTWAHKGDPWSSKKTLTTPNRQNLLICTLKKKKKLRPSGKQPKQRKVESEVQLS